MNKLSALLITFNEIKHIEAVISNVSFADEIIVVDGGSTDGTLEKLATLHNVTTIERNFTNFADQRNFALLQANNDWVLFIDADERLTNELKLEIKATINDPKDIVAFMVQRLYYFKEKRIRFSGFQTDTTYRLFNKHYVHYFEDKIVHELPDVKGKSRLLKHKMLHYCFNSAAHYKQKMEHYGQLKALELHKKNKKATLAHFIIRPAYKFLVNYIFRLGILDGVEGFQICYLSAYGVYFRYKTLKALNATSKT